MRKKSEWRVLTTTKNKNLTPLRWEGSNTNDQDRSTGDTGTLPITDATIQAFSGWF
jgi:hypothetical protein